MVGGNETRIFGRGNSEGVFPLNPLICSMGLWNKYTVIDKFGKNPTVGTSFEDVWGGDGTQTILSVASTMIVDSSGVDTVGGTGALTVELEGLDGDYNVITEDVTLDEASSPTTTNSFLRVYRVRVTSAGTGQVNANQIDINATTGASLQAVILADEGQTQQAIYTIPARKNGYLNEIFLSTDTVTNRNVTGQLQVRPFGEAWQVKREKIIGTGTSPSDMTGSGPISEKSDIKWRALASTGTTNQVSAGFTLILEDIS